jgi:hypothetical protein
MKVMSIIGIVWFSLSLLCVLGFFESELDVSAGWGFLGLLYALPYSIVGLVKSSKKQKIEFNSVQVLKNLNELKEKGILTEDEFQAKKIELWKQL